MPPFAHLLREPETTIEPSFQSGRHRGHLKSSRSSRYIFPLQCYLYGLEVSVSLIWPYERGRWWFINYYLPVSGWVSLQSHGGYG